MLTLTGAGMLWVGWFGFNAGSELAADGRAGMAMLVTQVATATAALTWMFAEWMVHGKPSAFGVASGAVAGLVAITPASGYVGPEGALGDRHRVRSRLLLRRRQSEAIVRLRRFTRRVRRARHRRHDRRAA